MKNKMIIGLAALLLACGTAQAQTNNTAGPVQPDIMPPTAWHGVTEIYQAFESATNWTVPIGGGRGLSGQNNNLAFVDLAYNIVTTTNGLGVGLVVGDEIIFGKGKPQVSTVAGGISFDGTIAPFGFIGLKSFTCNVSVADLMATPQNGNAIGNLVVTTASIHSFTFKNFSIGPAISWENRQGQGRYDGNYILGMLTATRLF